MPNDNEKLKQVHRLMRMNYSDTPRRFDEFKESMMKSEVNEKVHEILKSKYDDVPRNLTTFRNSLGVQKKISQQEHREALGLSQSEDVSQDYFGDKEGVKSPMREDDKYAQDEIETKYGDIEKTPDVNDETKDDIASSFDEGDPRYILQTEIQKEYDKKYPNALTPPEKINRFQDELVSMQEEYKNLIQNKPLKQEQFKEQYKDEVRQLADSLGLNVGDDGNVVVPSREIETYKEIYRRNLKKVIEAQKEQEKDSFGKDVLERVASSAERLYNIPTNVFAIAEIMHNASIKLFNDDYDEQTYWKDLAQYRNQKVGELRQKSERYDGSITELVKQGNVSDAVGETVLQISEQIPQLLVFAGTGAVGASKQGLGYIATGVGTEDYVQSIDEDKSEAIKIMSSLTKGLSEFAFEAATTLPILKSIRANVARYGQDAVEREMKNMFQTSLQKAGARIMKGSTNGLIESAGEVATELTQQFADAAAGEDVNIGENLGDVALTSYIIGDAMTRVGGALNQKTKGEAKRYLKDLYRSIPEDMGADSKIEALELLVKRNNLQGKMQKSAEGFKEGYSKQIKLIDQRLNNLYEQESEMESEAQQETQKTEEGKTTQEGKETKKQPKIIQELEAEGEPEYRVGDIKYESKEAFLEKVEQFKGEKNPPDITVNNDAQTLQEATNILQEGLKEQEQTQQTEQEQRVEEPQIEARQQLETLSEELNRLPENKSPNEIGKKFAKISNKVTPEERQTFLDNLKERQKKFRESQEAMEADREELIDYDNQTAEEIGEDVAETEQVNPRSIMQKNKQASNPGQATSIAQMQKNSFIELDLDMTTLEDWHRKYFSARGYVPKQVFDKYIESQGKFKAEMNEVNQVKKDFNEALKKHYGQTPLRIPKVSKSEIKRLNKLLGQLGATEQVTPPEGTQMRMRFKKRPSREEVLEKIPEPLREPMVKMRDHVDRLTKRMLDEGMIEGDLAAKFTENFGFYLTRSYRAHNSSKWNYENVPNEIKNKAINFLRKQNPQLTEEEIDGEIRSLLYGGNMPFGALRTRKLGSKDLGILKKRTLEAKEIRDLLGEYEDPAYNYATSVARMADLLYREEFLKFTEKEGKGIFLHDKKTGRFHQEIAAEQSKAMAPLSGYYTTPEIAEAFATFEKVENMSQFMRYYYKANTFVKYGKTILSPKTHVRNFGANYLFHWANGRIPVGRDGPFVTLIKDIANRNKKEWQEYYNSAIKHGVAQESVWRGEVHSSIKDMMKYQDDFTVYGEALFKKLRKKGLRALEKAYQKEDDIHKLVAWEGETRRYKKVYKKKNPDKTDAEIEEMARSKAASIVRNTMPTYSLATGKVTTFARRFPLVGTFVSFPAEVLRTGYNTVDIALDEMKDPDTKSIGAQRIAGAMAATVGFSGGVRLLSQAIGGLIDKEDLDDVRKFIAPWSRNSTVMFIEWNGDGTGQYIDVGYSDPYNYLKTPIIAAMRGDDITGSISDALGEFFEPFLGEEILAGKLDDVKNNTVGNTGNRVYNPAAAPGDKVMDSFWYLLEGVEPGAISDFKRVMEGFEGKKGRDPVKEIASIITGQRVSPIDVSRSFYFRMKDLVDQYKYAKEIYTTAKYNDDLSNEEKIEKYNEANKSARKYIKEMNDLYRSAMRLQAPPGKLDRSIRGLISKPYMERSKLESMIKTGGYIPIQR